MLRGVPSRPTEECLTMTNSNKANGATVLVAMAAVTGVSAVVVSGTVATAVATIVGAMNGAVVEAMV